MYTIRFYRDPNGVQPAKEYLRTLHLQHGKDARIQVRQIASYIQLLADQGLSLNKKFIDKVNEKYNIWELRPGCNRIFFVAWVDGMFVLLHAFHKKTQKTPKAEIDRAIREVIDLRERGLNDEKEE